VSPTTISTISSSISHHASHHFYRLTRPNNHAASRDMTPSQRGGVQRTVDSHNTTVVGRALHPASSTICAKPGYGARSSLYFSSRVPLEDKKGKVVSVDDYYSTWAQIHQVAPRKHPEALLQRMTADKHVRVEGHAEPPPCPASDAASLPRSTPQSDWMSTRSATRRGR
jgi:hypothetical protein